METLSAVFQHDQNRLVPIRANKQYFKIQTSFLIMQCSLSNVHFLLKFERTAFSGPQIWTGIWSRYRFISLRID